MAKPYGLWKRKRGKKTIYYYRLGDRSWRSTGCSRQQEAIDFALLRLEEAKVEAARKKKVHRAVILRDYLEPFYRWESCPHVARLRAEKHPIGREHAKHCRSLIDRYILTDPIAELKVEEFRRGDVLDFRQRLLQLHSDRQVNRIIGVLKTTIKEGIFREELEKDPTVGVGTIREKHKEKGIFSREELLTLFSESPGPWEDLQAYTCFLVAASTGMRRGEILALRWKDLDAGRRLLHVCQAWKSDKILGAPKWERERTVPLPFFTVRGLKELRASSLHVLPDALIFHNWDGKRKSAFWWHTRFRGAMEKAGINAEARNLTAHSFRHSLNTILREQGVPDTKIRAMLGWSNPRIQDAYTHLGPEHLLGEAELIDGIFK